MVKLPVKKKDDLFYVDKDEFVRKNQGLIFQRNAKEEITGLIIQNFNERKSKTGRKGISCKKICL